VDEELEIAHAHIYDPALAPCFHEVMRRARRECPVAHTDGGDGYWWVTRYEDIRGVLADARSYTNTLGVGVGAPPTPNSLIEYDPPLHTQFRRLLDPVFTRRSLEQHAPTIRSLAQELVDGVVGRGRCEVMHELAGPLAAAVLTVVVLGLDFESNRDGILDAQAAVATTASGGESQATDDVFGPLVERIVEERRLDPTRRDDLLARLLTGEIDGRPLTEREIFNTVNLFIRGGLDTTTAAIGNLVLRVCEHPELEERLRRSDWARTDIDEFLRLDTPIVAQGRVTTRDVELGGQPIKAGERVLLAYSSGNRDERKFTDPDRVDLDRERTAHLAFGGGVHRCIGSNLARMQIEAAVDALLARVEHLRLEPGATIAYQHGFVRHPRALPVVFESRG
jgi:cytochrome P450